MKEFAVYTLARLGLLVASWAVVSGIWLLVTGDDTLPILPTLIGAALISSVASYYLLRGMRERFALVVQRRAEAASSRLEASRSKEDHDDETPRPQG